MHALYVHLVAARGEACVCVRVFIASEVVNINREPAKKELHYKNNLGGEVKTLLISQKIDLKVAI